VVDDLWDNRSVVRLERTEEKRRFLARLFGIIAMRVGKFLSWKPTVGTKLSYPKADKRSLPMYPSQIDFVRGIADQARAIQTGDKAFFSGDVALHITEIALALNNAGQNAQPYRMRSSF